MQSWLILAILIAIPVLAQLVWRKPVVLISSIALSYFVVGLLAKVMPDIFALAVAEHGTNSLDQYYQITAETVWFNIASFLAIPAIITGFLTLVKALFYPRFISLLFWLLHLGTTALVILPRLFAASGPADGSSQETVEMLQLGGHADTLVILCVLCLVILLIWSVIRRLTGRTAQG